MTRRHFIGNSLAFGTALLADVLRAAEKGPAVLSEMKLVRRTIPVGLGKPFSIVQVSDTHLVGVSAADLAVMDAKAVAWYEKRREVFVGGIRGLAAAIAYARQEKLTLFHTGDLIDFASRANLAAIGMNLGDVDWFYSCGNHEFQGWNGGVPAIDHGRTQEARDADRAAYEKLVPNPIVVASRVLGGVNFVQYDNGGFSDYHGNEQFAAVRAEFAKGLPVVLLCHMPFWSEALGDAIIRTHPGLTKDRISTGYVQGRPDKPNWGGRLEMANWLRQQANLKAILCGHLHHDFIDAFTPSVNQYVAAANYSGNVYRYDFV